MGLGRFRGIQGCPTAPKKKGLRAKLTKKDSPIRVSLPILETTYLKFLFTYIYLFIYSIIWKYRRENDRTIYETSISMYITMTYETNIGSITFGVRPDPHERSAIDQEGYTVIFLPMGDSSEAPTVVPPDRVPTMAMWPAVFSTSPSGPSSELTIINRDSQNRWTYHSQFMETNLRSSYLEGSMLFYWRVFNIFGRSFCWPVWWRMIQSTGTKSQFLGLPYGTWLMFVKDSPIWGRPQATG